ncbi:glycoside hydrolase family 16 protein [Nakamurella flavida]|uniref:Glycoside hydrolase family 16 protein n=1 Tax=Nakamurella flavida TaxID=363630 RepID=A0A939C258_9ACTN|nr:glycoside hydrolase family 16 protein [Nakamurella flavida]MBM9475711.1 glycoside hydrolase family 16 protein [Nakamurella flavida]MDP9778011.1 hypothetical protein [Nakamurella flavida]
MKTPRKSRTWALPLVALMTAGLAVTGATPASADVSFSASGLTASVDGTSVTASVKVASDAAALVRQVGICVRDANGGNEDFPKWGRTWLNSDGRTLTVSGDLPSGTYTYWACVLDEGAWYQAGSRESFTVGGGSASPAPAVSAGGSSMPVGNLSGWRQIFTEDFRTDQAEGRFPGVYAANWKSYDGFPDTHKNGWYNQDIISVHDGYLDMRLHSKNGMPQGAAPIPLLDDSGKVTGQTYGRYSVRFKADKLPDYGMGWLLWPTSGNWNDGEIDFPEGDLGKTIHGYNHCLGNPSVNCAIVETGVPFAGGWHTATLEWTPSRITFILDGVTYRTTTKSVPSKPMQWVLQTASAGTPADSTAGHVLIDWVSIYAWNGA